MSEKTELIDEGNLPESQPEAGSDEPALSEAEAAAQAEEDAAWNEIKAGESGEPVPVPDEPKAKTDDSSEEERQAAEAAEAGAKPASEADAANVEKLWDDVSPELKSAFEAEKARADQAEHAFRSREGREASLTRRLDAMIAAPAAVKPGDTAANRQPSDDPKRAETAEALDAFMADYPEIAKPVKAMLDQQQSLLDDLHAKNQQMETAMNVVGQERLDAATDTQHALVVEAHPDYNDIAGSDDFMTWWQEQPDFIQAGIEANKQDIVDGPGVRRILDMYKSDRGITSGKKEDGSTAGKDAGKRQPADLIRDAQLRSATGVPKPSPGAAVPEQARVETEEDVWKEIELKEKQRIEAAA